MNRIEPVPASEFAAALGRLLAAPESGRPASARQVSSFLQYVDRCRIGLTVLRLECGSASGAIAGWLALPGRTAVVLLPNDLPTLATPLEQERLLLAVIDGCRLCGPTLIQTLLAPVQTQLIELTRRGGFTRLTRLLYLERQTLHPWCDPPGTGGEGWIAYSETRSRAFAETILATYAGSADCPELNGRRSIDDILAAHRAAGPFDPSLWELVYIGGRAAGCLLLARLVSGDAIEVSYIGVVPEFRRRGVGALLLRRTVEQARRLGVPRITLTVDERNTSARGLYGRFGFTPFVEREALILLPVTR
jgi:ribosomal protein S18 acetylase RimI-like enzyme